MTLFPEKSATALTHIIIFLSFKCACEDKVGGKRASGRWVVMEGNGSLDIFFHQAFDSFWECGGKGNCLWVQTPKASAGGLDCIRLSN